MNLKHFLITGLIATSACHGSEKRSNQVVKIGHAISIGLPFVLSTYQFLNYIARQRKKVKHASPASQKVVSWAQPHIAACGIDDVRILVGKKELIDGPFEAIAPNIIYIDPSAIESSSTETIEHQDKTEEQERKQKRDFYAFAIPHEIGHLHHKDTSYTQLSGIFFGLPLAIQATTSGISMLLSTPAMPTTASAQALFLLLKLAAGMSKHTAGNIAKLIHCRYQEKRADEFACEHSTSPDILRGAADFFDNEVFPNCIVKYLNGKPFPENFRTWSLADKEKFFRSACFVVDAEHPYPGDRSDMLREAADKLEAEQLQENTRLLQEKTRLLQEEIRRLQESAGNQDQQNIVSAA